MSFTDNIGRSHVEPGPDQCEMIDPHHPDCTCRSCRMMVDVQCLEPAVGTVPENGNIRVCAECAKVMAREFEVRSYRLDRHLRRWFELDDDGHVQYLIVAVDLDHAKNILRKYSCTFGPDEVSLDKATTLTWTELTPDQVECMTRCHTEDDRGVIPLAQADLGDWFCSEW